MNRKQTILIAVLVNASLLVVLFVTALTTQEEIALLPSSPIVQTSLAAPKIDTPETIQPLFGDASDQALREPPESVVASLPAVALTTPEPTTCHPLPAKVSEPAVDVAKVSEHKETPPIQEVAGYIEIVVKKGDSLDKLAKEYHTSVSELIKINRLPSSFLKVGQLLKVPAQRKSSVPSKPAEIIVKEEGAVSYYTVKVGDNPWTIAMKHNMKVDELLRLNGLNEEKARKLKPGDRLRTKYTPGH